MTSELDDTDGQQGATGRVATVSPSVKELIDTMARAHAQLKPRGGELPQVARDVPLSQVLQSIRRTLHQQHRPEAAKSASRDAEPAGADNYIAHLSDEGLDILEEELLEKLQRVRATREQRRGGRAAERSQPAARAEEEQTPRTQLFGASSLAEALSKALSGGTAVVESSARHGRGQQAADSSDGGDVESYEARLAAEGQRRVHGSRHDHDDEGEGEGSQSGRGMPQLQDVLQQLLGGEGQVVEFKVLVGDDAVASTGPTGADGDDGTPRSKWAGLLESLLSTVGGDSSQGGADDDDDV